MIRSLKGSQECCCVIVFDFADRTKETMCTGKLEREEQEERNNPRWGVKDDIFLFL